MISSGEGKFHYLLVRNFFALVFGRTNHQHHTSVCPYCLYCFSEACLLAAHLPDCSVHPEHPFDTIYHAKLLDRMRIDFGICGVALEWIASYLVDRQQYVKIGQHSPSTRKQDSGVPQESVLGPMLFTAYVSSVGDVITSMGLKQHQYADNTQLYFAVRASHYNDDLNIIEKCTSSIQDWFLVNDLLLN